MALLKTFRDVPPGGWRYVQPESGVRFFSDSFEDLVKEVRAHREYRGFPTEGLELDIQRQLCVGLTDAECAPEPGETYRPVKDLTAQLTASMVASLSAALAAFIIRGAEFVEVSESGRRAAICRGCPFNKPAKMCACAKSYHVIDSLIPAKRKVEGVSVCMACGCSLQAKINLPLDVIAASLPPDITLPEWCWQKAALPLAE